MTWIPENERDTSWYIFNQKFRCSVPHIAMRSTEHLQHFGMPSCGIKEIDTETARERIDTYLSIAQMVEYFQKGTIVGVKKVADTKIIYERIVDHLNAWKKQLREGLNNGEAPLQDLIDLDQFANAVYAHAQFHFTNDIVESLLMRRMDEIMPFNRDTLVAGMKQSKKQKDDRNNPKVQNNVSGVEEDVVERKQHASMADFFNGYQGHSTLSVNRWGDDK